MTTEAETVEYKPRPRAADDDDAIYARIVQLRREREQARANQTDDPAPTEDLLP
jgi:hypothetical protein